MKIPEFSKDKAILMLGVIGAMAVLWVLQKWFEKQTRKPESQTGFATSTVHYKSEELRKLPCGRFRKQSVELDGPTGVKSVQLLDKDGSTVLQEKKMPIDGDHCTAISHGKFIPELWKDCSIDV